MSLVSRCLYCEADFETHNQAAALCPRCQQREDREYANTTTLVADTDGRPYARRAMQERLGASGTEDA